MRPFRVTMGGFPAPAGMDPAGARLRDRRARIPRTRGDGPVHVSLHGTPPEDSPHPRGWTVEPPSPLRVKPGFPAPAGMDPRQPEARSRADRIPRTRGDGPRPGRREGVRWRDSPHPRGWTLVAHHDGRLEGGFPAPAGMDPQAPCPSTSTRRIPRTRGDGPLTPLAPAPTVRDSPHPRGWTRPPGFSAPPKVGFPAPAGMDPSSAAAWPSSTRIPRTRGDGPPHRPSIHSRVADSPHPRGWTPCSPHDLRRSFGFPAPAGMDRPGRRRRGLHPRIPRTRGDGPCTGRRAPILAEDSPHPRGWTPMMRGQHITGRGFPAPAGMDPMNRHPVSALRRIPRTRGDGPRADIAGVPLGEDSPHPRGWTRPARPVAPDRQGFPAPAGMDPARGRRPPFHRRIPRTRGDGPGIEYGVDRRMEDSPHPRGWTRGLDALLRPAPGFPAPAGMDPRQPHRTRSGSRIPRTRGDGPEPNADTRPDSRDSPHPRGWTGRRPEPPWIDGGFPAPAGMDPAGGPRRSRRSRIPRTRGDGPAPRSAPSATKRDSPHPRGWTRGVGHARDARGGFPAPAGMDRDQAWPMVGAQRIPRTRGDGPSDRVSPHVLSRDSPHPRGWTPGYPLPEVPRGGFPAPAGMDPSSS